MSKYKPLERFLIRQNRERVQMRFSEIETLIGQKLPDSAYRHRPWWANEAYGHSHAKAWLAAEYETAEVDMEGRKLTFIHTGKRKSPELRGKTTAPRSSGELKQNPMIGALKGLITIEMGHDLTSPAMPEWAETIEES